jgi:hypothetical protein
MSFYGAKRSLAYQLKRADVEQRRPHRSEPGDRLSHGTGERPKATLLQLVPVRTAYGTAGRVIRIRHCAVGPKFQHEAAKPVTC